MRLEVKYSDFAIAALIFDHVFVESLRRKTASDLTREKVERLCAQKQRPIGMKDLARNLEISESQAYGLLNRAAASGTIRRANKPEKANRKVYVPAPAPRFVPEPGELFQSLRLKTPVRFIHPITGEVVEYRRKKRQ
jgi:hypothetical protein